MIKTSLLVLSGVLGLAIAGFAAENTCGVCSMTIPEKAKQHFLLKNELADKAPIHVCSGMCLHKALKKAAPSSKVEVVDFNHPDKWLEASKAFFLVKSEKIRSDMGEMAMAPFVAAFPNKAEAEKAHAKYGDGVVVEGIDNALKALKK